MGLDIKISQVKTKYCPHCGEMIAFETISEMTSGGGTWYEWLEKIGYYKPSDKETEENDWYGTNVMLTEKQTKSLLKFIRQEKPAYYVSIAALISDAITNENKIIINADW